MEGTEQYQGLSFIPEDEEKIEFELHREPIQDLEDGARGKAVAATGQSSASTSEAAAAHGQSSASTPEVVVAAEGNSSASTSEAAAAEGQSSPSTSEAAAEGSKPLVRKCRKLLYRSMKVGVEDGRVFVGIFHCLDKQGNIILHSTVEYREISSRNGGSDGPPVTEERPLGLVLIPARCRTSCFVQCSLDESMDLLSLDS